MQVLNKVVSLNVRMHDGQAGRQAGRQAQPPLLPLLAVLRHLS